MEQNISGEVAVSSASREIPDIYGTTSLITVFTYCHLSLF
jgi:hypothetical protein